MGSDRGRTAEGLAGAVATVGEHAEPALASGLLEAVEAVVVDEVVDAFTNRLRHRIDAPGVHPVLCGAVDAQVRVGGRQRC